MKNFACFQCSLIRTKENQAAGEQNWLSMMTSMQLSSPDPRAILKPF